MDVLEVFEVNWSITVEDEAVAGDSRLFTNPIAQKRYETEVMVAAKLLKLDEYISISTPKHKLEN